MKKNENEFLIVYSYKDDIKATIYFYDNNADLLFSIYEYFNIINNFLITSISAVSFNVILNVIIRLHELNFNNKISMLELGLNPQKISQHIKQCCDYNKIFIDENEKNVRISFLGNTVTYKDNSYHAKD